MLALAIEFSRCSRIRTLKAEQCARRLVRLPHGRVPLPCGRTNGCEGCRLRRRGPVLSTWSLPGDSTRIGRPHAPVCQRLLRKEVIQPQLPLRLPCYDFTPIASPTFDGSLLTVRPPASGVAHFRGVTGGVYKARERIHRSIADLRLLATPTSRGRVADLDPN
jgi:hypothetical protein